MYLCHGERTCRWVNLCEHADAMFESPNVTTTKTLWWYGQNKQYIQTNKQLITQNINVAIIIPRRNKTVAQYCMKFIIPELKQCITSQKRAIKIFLEHKKKKIQSGVTEKILEISWTFIWNSIIQLESCITYLTLLLVEEIFAQSSMELKSEERKTLSGWRSLNSLWNDNKLCQNEHFYATLKAEYF